ncbi:ABC transporter ATP-binding protein/permease [Methylocystis echinoides]|uniref:ABC transporter ATP-binding protein/permease n=1 Tax=Methylocystis echinoides TaxID=29468 RepID=UPI00341C9EFE
MDAVARNARDEETPSRLRWLRFIRVALLFWTGESRTRAVALTIAVFVSIALQLSGQLGSNAWSRYFFDALEKRRGGDIEFAIYLLIGLVIFSATTTSAALVAKMLLQTRWREWLTHKLAGWWLEDQRYYRLEIESEERTAPEFRLARDAQLAIDPLVEFAIGLVSACVTASAFVGILWSVGGGLAVTFSGQSLYIPGYLAFASVGYTAILGTATLFLGAPMVRFVAEKNEMEGQFLAELTRVKENAESIALIRGDADEFRAVMVIYANVVQAWIRQITRNGIVASVQSANGALAPLLPLVLVAPKYLSGELSLGAVMQLASAFISVQIALSWFIDNFVRVAEWMASAQRVAELIASLEALDVGATMTDQEFIEFGHSSDGRIHLRNLAVAHRDGQVVILDANLVIEAGEKLLVGGASGTGKSTLVRALAGLWPWGSGSILLPRDARIAFAPQQPYIPRGNLRQVLLYSVADADVTDDMIRGAMLRCGLDYLTKYLDDESRWDQKLSGGERQRIAFARMLLQRPDIIIMDEATSALDEGSQTSLLRLLNEDLSYATVISVGHRPGMEDFHDSKLVLERRAAGARVKRHRLEKSLWHLIETGP